MRLAQFILASRPKHLLCLISLAPLAGCATITAPEEAGALSESATDFGAALKAAELAQSEARVLAQREAYRTDVVLRGGPVQISLECLPGAERSNDALDKALMAAPYDPSAGDEAFRALQQVAPCDSPGAQEPRTPGKPLERRELALAGAMGTGARDLSGAARQLDRYTKALADVATNETGAETDAARSKLITAGQGLLAALGVGGPLEQIAAIASQAINSIVAAKRNAEMRQFLNGMDPAMPALMERLGLQARVAQSQAALNSARSAHSIGKWVNDSLNGAEYIENGNRTRRGTRERAELYDQAADRLANYNALFLSVTDKDPMKAAVAYAVAHHELTKLYNDPRASRRSVAEALAGFQEAASALAEALKKPPGAKEGATQ